MTGSTSNDGTRRSLRSCMAALCLCALASLPAVAQDQPSLKDILGRAQSASERKAVEDLIGKLQGKGAQPKPETPEVAKPAPVAKEPRQDDRKAMGQEPERAAVAGHAPDTSEQPASAGKAAEPLEGAPSSATASRAQEPRTEDRDKPPDEPPQVAAKPAPELADVAVEKAEQKQLPSVDLEVLFERNSASLTPAAVETLTTLGRALSDARLAGGEFLIGGHSDAKGRADYNQELSQQRADAVRQFLIATFGIDAEKLTAKGFGERHLKNPQQPRAAENRRVQIVNVSRQEAR